ncbi:midasin isoform X1 [Populus alba x Populus x berolinensis]|uniref:Midasin n=2 Tax=Populus alba x Populus x berolinensis TaxID=444605 RepID=A0AAD6LEW9_9ROSI|nr:midasin isoform X1 [Populus alba x Populus x berolinensis]
MAMDGSFSLESTLERFLIRCPKLSTIDKLQRFVETGHTVTEEEVVKLLAELFLNPNYTIPLIGSFRPLARMIVDQAVALLRNCNLSSDSDDIEGDFVDADVLYVIEHYERSGRGLELHELACLAFCRALDLDHSLLGSVTTYFKFAPPPFERISRNKVVSEAQLFQAANHYLLAVRISYRLLLMQPEFFSEQWNWSCFLDHVKKLVNLDLVHVAKDAKVVADIKWCGIQILCTILGMSDKAVENFGVGAEEATSCLLRWEEFCQDVAIEKFCLCVGSSEQTNFGSFTGGIKFGQQNFLKSCGLNSLILSHCHQIEPVIKSRRVVTWDERSTAYPFVVTSMMSKSFEMVLLAVSQKWPVLLYGPPGAGKTALINKLAQDAGNQVLSIHMDDQIDGKTLIGSYVCTDQPGEFRWQPGSLIQAVLNGYWVVFEDIDKAPSDVQSILLPLLEGETSFITSHGEEIRVAESFQLFSTITTSKSNVSHTAEVGVHLAEPEISVAGGSSLSTLWRRVMIGLPSNDDLENIMKAWYPSLGPLTGRLIETMERVNPSPPGSSACLSCLNRFSLRDLLKWCKRIAELGFNGEMLTAYQCHLIYQEAVDIFASFSVPSENRLTVMRDIAKLWGVPISEAEILYPCKPEIQNLFTELRIGRVTLQRTETVVHGQERLVEMRSSLYVLEQIACAVKYNEPILLVGETGTGKTTLVQNLAKMLGQKLTVLNLSQQSDVADLLGGFKPIDSLSICIPLYKEFEILFSKTFSMKENDKIFAYLQKQMKNKNWKPLLNGFKKYVDNFQKKLQTERSGSGKKRKKPLDENIRAWESFSVKLEAALRQIEASSGMLFSFVEGSFITALRNGEWILLDEVNLAPPETLQRVIGVLEGEYGSLCLAERGDVSHIPRNPSFRVFACMNPATDAGKRDLPYSLQSRFTAYFVHDVLDRDDLKLFINKFMEESISNIELEKKIIDFYEAAKKNSEERLQDGANQKPQYSLRSLYRALEYTREAKGKFGFPKAIYDGFCMFFLTMLDRPSAKIMKKMIKGKLLGGNKPSPVPFDAYLRITKISGFDDLYKNYVLTKSVKKQLENLARAVFIKRYPVLLQGPTSSGKTSLVQYLAARTGHEFVRINNHEHTDLQEYLGSYISDAQGKLVFQEGILVKAVRNGHWIVLDELNLAPSDVLEALNRLLDDNRELFLPELRETVRAHPNFMLFATQNPPTFYGGRKMLSRAFRNRFVEVHVDEIPDDELSTIIEKRCKIPGSRARLMVEVMKELQLHRQSSKVFAGKHGFITPRDLFRWANRLRAFGDSKEVMAEHGYYLLADRLRDERERHVVQEVLERRLRVKIVGDHLYKALGSVSNLIESAMKHSLTFSTRPPQNFIPHQKILWTLDAWMSVDAVNAKIASYVLEMWFWWHSSLWSHCPVFSENFGKVDGYHTPLPDMLVQSVRTASVVQSLQRTCAIKDYSVHCLKLKAASCNLWQSSLPGMDLSSFLLSVTRSLFQQIIYAHRKAFDADKFAAIKSIFCSFHKNVATQDDIQCLVSILGSSNHQKLNSLVSLFIEPILKELYLHFSSTEVYLNMGHAFLKIGALRFSLLLSCDDFDPALKYSFKHSQLEERISSLELEIKVRQECDYLAGRLSSIEADKKRADSLERLEFERRRIQKKMVFRCNPLKFNALRKECGEFLKPARMVVGLVDNIEGMDLQQVLEQASNWQATATSFIDRLSDEYKEYIDLAQPFQVAVYEMKLGLSLVLSFALLKKVLNRIKEDNMDRVMESIYSFMRFPRVCAFVPSSSHCIGSPATFWDREMGFLEKLIMLSSDVTTEKMGSILQLKTGLYQNIVVRVAHFVADAQRIDDASFKILDKMFHEFANMWMNMKVQVKCKEGDDAQQYKFRPRALEIKSIVDVDFSTLDQFFPNDSFSEWQEFLSEEESLEKLEASNEHESVQDEWNLIQETIMKKMICIHNQLFGSTNLVLYAGTCHVVEADRLHSFTNSYTLGVGMIEGLGGLLTSSLDGKLIPEHLLRLCLEHGSKLVSSQKSSANYNFYKDSNAPMMAKMVKLVANLEQQIHSLLSEWEDHPGLQKIMDTIQMLLAIPVETPLAKALLGLQFLLNRARTLQENESKFPLSDQLEPISALVCSWQKMEFDSWPALLHEVQEQYDINAGKLWFPLFSVLHHSHSGDIAGYEQSTIERHVPNIILEEFIRTSSIGEFRARLQLLFSLHGQITVGRCLDVQNYSSMRQEKNLQILYNVFGYYIQFLPSILENIEANRKGIEMELKDILKLFHWERTEICLSVENSKRTRQKLRKLMLKYTDLLQQPVMLILDREVQQKGPKIHSLQFPKALKDNKNTISDLTQFCEKDRSIWLADWRKKVTDTLQDMHFKNTLGLSFLDNKDVTSITRQCLASHSSHLSRDEQWNVLCWTVEKIFKTAMDCDDLWNDTGKGAGKKRALSELLKLLDTSGLHKHKFEIMKISNSSNWLFIQPSYNAQHLLLTPSRLSGEAFDVSTSSELQCLPDDYVDTMWKSANEFYFKSVASVQFMQRICLKPHGDITYDQASRAVSFLNHLIIIQQSQRAAAYGFSKQLKCLRECTYAFKNSYVKCTDIDERTSSEYFIVQNQHAFFQCMWKQKQLFDGLTTLLAEESLLLRTVESTHLKSCRSVRPVANHMLQFIEKFIPVTQKSKESLDNYLLGQLGGLQSLLKESLDKSLLGRVVTISAGPSRPYIISKQMEQLVYKNFQVIKEFEEHFLDFHKQDWNRSFIIETLLGHFDDVFKEGKMLADQFESALKQRSQSRDSSEEVDHNSGNNYQLGADFDSALKKAHNLVMEALEKQISPGDGGALSEESLENISSWEYLFKSSVQSLNVEELCDILLNIITCAKKMVDHSGSETSHISFHIGRCFQHLHLLLELILGFCDGLLQDLLAMHKTVSIMTRELANVLASLFSKGFGISVKDEVDEASHDTSQTASGTGMGEGSGLNDVSDQITDEDQLLGDEQDASGEVPNKNEKGIEMEDLTADTFSVSDDSGEENEEDGEDEQLDSAMGEAGLDSEVVDEKLQNKDEDDNPNNTNERYESGPSVTDNDTSSRELRAKEDSAAIADDEPGEPDKQNNEIGNQDDLDDREENTDDMNMDKETAFTDPTGLKLDESNQGAEEDMEMDEDMNEEGDLDSKEEISPEEGDESAEHGNCEEDNIISADETMEEPDSEPVDGTSVKDEPGRDREERSETNAMEPRKDEFELGISDLISDHVHGAESATQPNGPSQASDSKNATAEANMSNISEAHNDLALRSLPSGNTSQNDLMVSDSSNSGGFTNDKKQAQFPERESSSDQRAQPNPYRNVGNALEEWKERVKVSVDLPGDTTEASGEIEDKNADDYAFVSEFEKGTDQALGPATSEQIESNVNVNRSDEDSLTAQRDEVTKMEIEESDAKEWHLNHSASILKNKMEEQLQISDFKSEKEGSPEVQDHDGGDPQNLPESAISVRKSYLSEDIYQPDNLHVDDNDLGKALGPEEVPLDVKSSASALWSRYELRTTRLSQELAEQLRLVLEPTVASKLQGDYKTGKRINMKKVIPYIASHYRKDKIWLRRTRPNKRDYQVVIAVDDSRSMSESCCGDVAVEALVTVCRAMSQLEMGNMAVASFGKKGNIRSLHDFDQPFTGEAGKKIISSLTFKQENTIADEPVVDLLKYLNNMLDAAVAKARLPSGQNPLQQLVLIIADGRFHEKEKLKRCVRDFLSRKRMVAFLVLDSPQESIMDQMEASFVGEGEKRVLKFTKYLDSFPFPYYIVLKNIEALPRTLADLLRQWFELMQYSRE